MASKPFSADHQVNSIIHKYGGISEIHPLIKALNKDDKSRLMLVAVIEHEYDFIRTRSQDLDDHEITAAQKAFANLLDDNKDAAIHIYVEEILGLKITPDTEKASIIQSSIEIRAALLDGRSLDISTAQTRSTLTNHTANSTRQSTPTAASPEASASTTRAQSPSQDITSAAKLATWVNTLSRLEHHLETGTTEFREAEAGTYNQREKAKFVRDTIDNLVDYINTLRTTAQLSLGNDFYQDKLVALRELRQEANNKVLQGYKGNKRPFERTRGKPRPRPSLKRENAVLRSPNALSRSGVNSIRLGDRNDRGDRRGGRFRQVDSYRPVRG